MPKPDILPIENKNIILRLLEEKDLPLTLSWRNQDSIRKWFVNSDPIPESAHFAWFDQYKKLETDFVFIILAKDLDNLPVGQISLYRINQQSLRAEYGRLIIGDMASRGKGYAREATRILMQYAFTHMKLKEVYLEVKEDNQPAINLYRSCGFNEVTKLDGLIRMIINKDAFMKTNE